MGDDPLNVSGPGGFPEQGGTVYNREISTATPVQKFGLTPFGGGNMVGGFGGGFCVGLEEAEYDRALYCKANYYEPLGGIDVGSGEVGL